MYLHGRYIISNLRRKPKMDKCPLLTDRTYEADSLKLGGSRLSGLRLNDLKEDVFVDLGTVYDPTGLWRHDTRETHAISADR